MPFSFKYNVLYCHIPKTGGSSVEKYLEIVDIPDFGVDLEVDKKVKFDSDQHATYIESKATFLPFINSSTICLVTVRDPVDRLISHFIGRRGGWARSRNKTTLEFLFFVFFELPVLRLLLKFLPSISSLVYRQISHIRSQSVYLQGLRPDAELYKDVYICRIIDVPDCLSDRCNNKTMPHLRASISKTSRFRRCRLACTFIQLLYRDDHLLFRESGEFRKPIML